MRRCEIEDIPWMLELGQAMFLESRYARNSFSKERIWALLEALIPSARGIVLRTDHGFLIGGVNSYWFSKDLYAFDYVFYVQPEARRAGEAAELIQAYITAAKNLGVKPPDIMIENSTGVETEAVEGLFLSLGFARVGGNFVLEA